MNKPVPPFNIPVSEMTAPDLPERLFSVLSSAMPQTKAMLIYLKNGNSGRLELEHSLGLDKNFKGAPLSQAVKGLCSGAFSSNGPLIVSDIERLKIFANEMAPLAETVHFDDNGLYHGPTSIIISPILIDKMPYGVLFVINRPHAEVFSPSDLEYVTNITGIVSLKRKNDMVMSENLSLKNELKEIGNVINSRPEILAYANSVTAAFSSEFLKGHEFGEMLRLAHSFTKLPTVLYNMFLERISGTDGTEGVTLPSNIIDIVHSENFLKRDFIKVDSDSGVLFIMPVFHGVIPRGILIVKKENGELSDKEKTVLETLSLYLSFVCMKKTAVREQNEGLKREVLTGILSGKEDASMLPKLRRLGLAGGGKFFVLLISAGGVENHIDFYGTKEGTALLNLIDKVTSKKKLKSIIIPEYDNICVIVSCGVENVPAKRYENVVRDTIDGLVKESPDLYVSGSRIYENIYNVRKCYWEASQCMMIIKRYFLHRKSANFLDMGVIRLLITQNREDIEAYLEDILRPIVDYDERRGTELLTTLFYYTRFNKSIGYISKKLNIHPNTLYQRIKKIESLLGYDLNDPMDWFDIQAASFMHGLIYTDLITKIW